MDPNPNPFLTVAIPVYNGEAALAPMLASLDAQDWSLFEVRFGDDGSTDGTRDVLAGFAEQHPGSVFIDNHENIGHGPSRNRLLAQAAGEYIWFCDSDDELAPGCVARIAHILRGHPVDYLAFCYCDRPDDPGKAELQRTPVPVTPFELLLSMHLATWSKVMKTAMLCSGGIEFPSTAIGEDIVQSISAACHSGSALFWHAKPYWVRKRLDSVSGKIDDAFFVELFRSQNLAGSLAGDFPDLKNAIEVQMFDVWHYCLRRLQTDADASVRNAWTPRVKESLAKLVSACDNPLLRLPRAYSSCATESLRREREALKREQAALEKGRRAMEREQEIRSRLTSARKELASLRRSFSLRLGLALTWPARACLEFVRRLSGAPVVEDISERRVKLHWYASLKARVRQFLYGMVREYVIKDVRAEVRKRAKPPFDPAATAVLKRFSHLLRGHGINRERVEMEIALSADRPGTSDGNNIVVSLTSYPKRIYDLHFALHSLLMQTLRPEKVVLWLGEEHFPRHEADVPKTVLDLRGRGLEIRFTHDCRAYTKLIPALAAFPDKTIVTADDDIYYDPDWLERLVAASKQAPGAIWAIRAQKIGISGDTIQDCLRWRTMTEGSMPRFDNFLTGVGGVLYPPRSLAAPLCADEGLFLSLSPLNDDIWFWAMAVLNGTGIGVADGFPGYLTYANKMREYGFNDDGRLYALNKGENMHNIQFAAVLDRFPELREKLMAENRAGTTIDV